MVPRSMKRSTLRIIKEILIKIRMSYTSHPLQCCHQDDKEQVLGTVCGTGNHALCWQDVQSLQKIRRLLQNRKTDQLEDLEVPVSGI